MTPQIDLCHDLYAQLSSYLFDIATWTTKVTLNLKQTKWSNWISPLTHSSSFSLSPSSSAGKEFTCNTGDPGSTPGLGRSPGEEIDYTHSNILGLPWWLRYLVKNPGAKQETWDLAQSLDWEDPLEEGMATHSSILAWRIPMDSGSLVGYSPGGHKESDVTERLSAACK